MGDVQGFGPSSYGDAFADVYDDWYHDVSDVDATVSDLVDLSDGGRVLELGVGTGRIAIPLANAGVEVHGIDASTRMLDRLRAKDPDERVRIVVGDMVDDLPDGPFDLVVVAYNTLFNLTDDERQSTCVTRVAERLRPGGRFVVEAFVPDAGDERTDSVTVRHLDVGRVVLSASVHDAVAGTAAGQFIELSEHGGVRLRPWMVRYRTPAELDSIAAAAGLELEHRWSAFGRHTFDEHAHRHVSVYRRCR